MSVRLERMNEAIAHEVSAVLRKNFREEAAMVTIVGALVAPDLKSAIVKYSVLGDPVAKHQLAKFFSKHGLLIKKEIAHRLQLRNVPELKFSVTDAIAKGNHLIEVLDTIAPEDTLVE
ncbi:MAG: ribosome-binding factor A [Verrucomicrobiota bacterium]|nr:MAG: ribosome-binding factor A [Verrucomicrobiota bacterium]